MPRRKGHASLTIEASGEKHDNLMPLLQAMSREFQELSKKKPDGALNKRKVEIVNRLLREVHELLEEEPTSAYLDLLDEDDLPQNSDAVLILSQTVAAMERFREKYYRYSRSHGGHAWIPVE